MATDENAVLAESRLGAQIQIEEVSTKDAQDLAKDALKEAEKEAKDKAKAEKEAEAKAEKEAEAK